MHKRMMWLCILGCVLGALLSPASAYCGQKGGQNNECHPVGSGSTIQCATGSSGSIVYKPNNGDTRFKGADFKQSCLVNAGKTCASAENAVQHPLNANTSCCSCFLYASYCQGKQGFVTHTPKNSPDHTLLMPGAACTGVENWDQSPCPGESIWNEGANLISGKGDLWGMAINPVSRRGQHQMHVHLAEVPKSLMAAIVDGVNKPLTKFNIACSQSKPLDHCTLSTAGSLEVIIKQNHLQPSGAAPFATAYGPNPSRSTSKNALEASMLVLRLPKTNTWAIVTNLDGPAECFFAKKNTAKDLQDACS